MRMHVIHFEHFEHVKHTQHERFYRTKFRFQQLSHPLHGPSGQNLKLLSLVSHSQVDMKSLMGGGDDPGSCLHVW